MPNVDHEEVSLLSIAGHTDWKLDLVNGSPVEGGRIAEYVNDLLQRSHEHQNRQTDVQARIQAGLAHVQLVNALLEELYDAELIATVYFYMARSINGRGDNVSRSRKGGNRR